MNDRERPLLDWGEFEQQVSELEGHRVFRTSQVRNHALYFRGLGNATWGLETTLERAYPYERSSDSRDYAAYHRDIYAAKHELEVFGKRDFGPIPTPPEFDAMIAETDLWNDAIPRTNEGDALYRYLIYLRHHGFPSPLLDWTRSPYLAAFFAFDMMARNADKVAIYAVLRDSMHSFAASRANIRFIGPYTAAHPRHFRQQSDYSICLRRVSGTAIEFAAHEGAMDEGVGAAGSLYKITIPATQRNAFLSKLSAMNINPFTVYDSEDALVRTMARQRLLFR